MLPRFLRLALLLLSVALPSPGHQGVAHPPNVSVCDDIYLAIHAFKLFGDGVEAVGPQNPFLPQEYYISNDQPEGAIPRATVKLSFILGSGHVTKYTDFVRTVSIGDSRKYTSGTSWVIDPIIDGWVGTVTVHMQHKTCDFSMTAHAYWAFENPFTPQCQDCRTLTCDGRAEIKSIDIGIPVGPLRHGSESIEIGYLSEQIENEGQSKLTALGPVGSETASVTSVDGVLTSVTSGRHLARITKTPTANDPEKIRIEVSYDKDDPENTIYRTSTLESFTSPTPEFVYTDTVEGRTTTRTFRKPNPSSWTLVEDDLRRTTKTKLSESLTQRSYRFTTEERNADDIWVIVDQYDERETNYQWGWTLTQRIRDPLGEAVTTHWDYYDHSEFSGPNNDITGRGRLQSTTLPTGLVRSHTYHDSDPLDPGFDQLHVTTEAFADRPDAKEIRVHSKYDAPFLFQKRETFLDGHLVEVVDTTARSDGGGRYRIETRYPASGGAPQVTRHDYDDNPGTRFYSKLTKPDGTVEVINKQVSPGQMKTSTFKGTFNSFSKTTPIVTGSAETMTINDVGQEIASSRGVVHNRELRVIEERLATNLDHLDRPLSFDVFHGELATPSYSELIEYGCCGISRRTGRDGIAELTFYDDLGRMVKTHRNGLSTETGYDGLTTRLHTYPETNPSGLSLANSNNEVGFTTRNLIGHTVAEATRSPQDHSLQTTSTVTTYAPAPGIGMRTVTTAPQTTDDLGVPPSFTEDFYLDGLPAKTSGSLAADQQFTYTANPAGLVKTTSRLRADGTPFEPVTTQHDWLLRAVSVTYAGDADGNSLPDQTLTEFDSGGRPLRITDPDGVTSLFFHDLEDEITTSARDLNNNGIIDNAIDEVRLTRRGSFVNAGGSLILWIEQVIRNAVGAEQVLTRDETRSDGLESWRTTFNNGIPLTTHSATTELGPGDWDTTTTLPSGLQTIQRYRGGLLERDEAYDATGNSLVTRIYAYDAHQRVIQITDSSGPDLFTSYVSDLLPLVASRSLGTQTTSFTYDHRGRITEVDAPDSFDASGAQVDNRRRTSYFPHGAIREVTGSPGYHLSYTYDEAFRMQTLTTYGTHTATTRWAYDPLRGWLSSKRHDSPTPGSGSGPSYTYTAAGRVDSRLSERGITTQYNYGPDGRLASTTYSDGTPSVSILDRDNRGRISRISDAAGERSLGYDDLGTLTSTSYDPGHLLSAWSVLQSHDQLSRLTALTLHRAGSDHHHLDYTYDPASRLDSIQGNNLAAWYHYDPKTQRVAQLAVSNSQQPLLFATRSHDNLNRLSRISYHNGDLHGQFAKYSDYQLQHDAFGHLTRATRSDGTQWHFGYNPAGELSNANLHLANSSPDHVLGHSLAWSYDGIGNRSSAKGGGDVSGTAQHQTTYTTTPLNQYSQIHSPGIAGVFGTAPPDTNVLVNGTSATRQNPFFFHEVTADNSNGPRWQDITIQNGPDTTTGHRAIPAASVAPTHDADGNLLTNGLWQFTWDAENRLTQVESTTEAIDAGIPYQRITYLYDADNRRLRRQFFDTPDALTPTKSTRFLYAGWRCLGEVNELNNLSRSFAWGLDNADSLHLGDPNAALLWIHDHDTNETHLTHYDHNGNITGLLSAQSQQPTAQYAYSPFGQLLTSIGPYAHNNPYRFSTQYQDQQTNLIYYGHRHLNPETGRWLSRDPIEEAGGNNLYAFLNNNSTNSHDTLGLALYAFDGTGNVYNQKTHVGLLTEAYEGNSFYAEGVGTTFRGVFDNKAIGGITGAGGKKRLEAMYEQFEIAFASGDEQVDIIGFSRGAALARAFANLLNERGFIDPKTGKCRQVKIRFIGLFDTVASFGIPGNDHNIGFNFNIPQNVEFAAHAVARDEMRALFPVTPLNRPKPDQHFFEYTFPGDHSDIGGGHSSFKNGKWISDNRLLSKGPLNFVHFTGRLSGAPFGPVQSRTLIKSTKPHNKAQSIGGILGPILLGDYIDKMLPVQPRFLPYGYTEW